MATAAEEPGSRRERLRLLLENLDGKTPREVLRALIPGHRGRSLKELLALPREQLGKADLDQLRLFTGSMAPEHYLSLYAEEAEESERPLLSAITTAVWGSWDKVELPGTLCSDGSPYKFFVMRSRGLLNRSRGYDKRLLVYLEPGGACWDYESCTGQTGIRGAANPNGIPDNFMNIGDFLDPDTAGGSPNAAISPLILFNHPAGDHVETARWNKVFLPYCTGDVHSGNSEAVYEDPTGANPPRRFYHHGAKNVEKVAGWLGREFPGQEKLMVTGCSAGGVGALVNYHFFRDAVQPDRSYLLNDSGPIFPAPGEGNHWPLHQKIRKVWNLDYTYDRLARAMPDFAVRGDYGIINTGLARYYPDDVIAATMFSRDANFSMYSYGRFFGYDERIPEEKEAIMGLWQEDIAKLRDQYDSEENLAYYIPWMRDMNSSHCTSIVEFTGTEIQESGVNLGDFVNDMLDDRDGVTSYFEEENPADKEVDSFFMWLVNLLL